MPEHPAITTFLFTDIEGSSALWEREPARMRAALARHDAIARAAVEDHRGEVVKTSGDGIHAAFGDPLDAVRAVVELQRALADPATTGGVSLRVRCGLHAGVVERRDNDFFGSAVNRAARIMGAAHGGQVLVSQAVAVLISERLPTRVELRDLGTIRLRDLAHPEHVYQLVAPQLRQDFPALRSLEATPNNLPQQVTSFIGRERELSEAKELIGKTRLLTLLGVGGLGKTRLSLQLAADVMDDYPDGVWFVELAAIADARMVAQAAATVLGVKEEAGRPVGEALMRAVKDRRLLLVLDNCEHVVDACAELAKDLLQAGPQLKILASSREPLRVAGETSYPMPALAVPDSRQAVAAETLLQFEAVRLFAERAMAAQPAFRITDRNATAVAEICRHLDGIPLAIELAAARLRALPVEKIAERLTDRFRLLTGGYKTALPRQQTLRALIDWSYDLLTEHERALLRRLAVFAGGWTLEAAEAVGAGGAIAEADVLDLLGRLVEKSLVVMEAERERYTMLETVRQYAQERLSETDEEDSVRKRHLDFYLSLAEKAGAGLAGAEQASWLRQFDVDRENLLSIHAWCLRDHDLIESDYRLIHAIKLYWFMRGLLNLGYRVTAEAVAIPALQPLGFGRCRALWVAGQICSYTGRYEEARRYLEESLAIARHHDDRRMIANVRNYLALAALGLGDRAAAQLHCEEALALARESGSRREIAVASNGLAQLSRLDGNLDRAEILYEEAVALAHELSDREFAAIGILGLTMVAIGRGSTERACELLREVLTIADATGSKPAGQSALEVSVGLAAARSDWERSARLYGAAEAQTPRTGIRRDPADEAFLQPLLARTRAALGDARFNAAQAAGRELSFEAATAEVRVWLASDG